MGLEAGRIEAEGREAAGAPRAAQQGQPRADTSNGGKAIPTLDTPVWFFSACNYVCSYIDDI